MSKSIDKILEGWKNSPSDERLGQYFCNRYIGHAYDALYYSTSTAESIYIIDWWLHDYNYEHKMPPRVDGGKNGY